MTFTNPETQFIKQEYYKFTNESSVGTDRKENYSHREIQLEFPNTVASAAMPRN